MLGHEHRALLRSSYLGAHAPGGAGLSPPLAKRPRRAPAGRQPGGQPGPEGHARVLVPIEPVDVVIPLTPARCRRCQQPLQGEAAQPRRHQVTAMPPVTPGGTA
jgi:hypothetical protein